MVADFAPIIFPLPSFFYDRFCVLVRAPTVGANQNSFFVGTPTWKFDGCSLAFLELKYV